jgi:hypothetical protein
MVDIDKSLFGIILTLNYVVPSAKLTPKFSANLGLLSQILPSSPLPPFAIHSSSLSLHSLNININRTQRPFTYLP